MMKIDIEGEEMLIDIGVNVMARIGELVIEVMKRIKMVEGIVIGTWIGIGGVMIGDEK